MLECVGAGAPSRRPHTRRSARATPRHGRCPSRCCPPPRRCAGACRAASRAVFRRRQGLPLPGRAQHTLPTRDCPRALAHDLCTQPNPGPCGGFHANTQAPTPTTLLSTRGEVGAQPPRDPGLVVGGSASHPGSAPPKSKNRRIASVRATRLLPQDTKLASDNNILVAKTHGWEALRGVMWPTYVCTHVSLDCVFSHEFWDGHKLPRLRYYPLEAEASRTDRSDGKRCKEGVLPASPHQGREGRLGVVCGERGVPTRISAARPVVARRADNPRKAMSSALRET